MDKHTISTPEVQQLKEGQNSIEDKTKEKKFAVIETFGSTIQGEGPLAGSKTMFVRFGGCIESSELVLMGDWTYKPISLIEVGDIIMAADLGNRGNKDTSKQSNNTKKVTALKPCKVLNVINKGIKEAIKLHTPVGSLICTPDHEIYAYKTYQTNGVWRHAEKLEGHEVRQVPIQEWSEEYSIGWLHGAFAGDGSIHKFQNTYWRMKLCSHPNDSAIVEKALEILTRIGAPNPHRILHNSGNNRLVLEGVEVTNSNWVNKFRDQLLKGRETTEYRRGWLAGFYDTDGSWSSTKTKASENSGQIWYWQNAIKNDWKTSRCMEYLTSCGFTFTLHERKVVANFGSVSEGNVGISVNKLMAFFTSCPGVLTRKKPAALNIQWIPKQPITSIEKVEDTEVWDITTELGNFFAGGMLVHNCDYRCAKCDSLHAVMPDAVNKHASYLSAQAIADAIIPQAQKTGTPWVTLSGGNPVMWDLSELVILLHKAGLGVAVETQGTLYRPWVAACQMVVVSPKSPGMGEKFEPEKLNKFMSKLQQDWELRRTKSKGSIAYGAFSLKVVVFSNQDLEFALELSELPFVKNSKIINQGLLFLSLGNPHPPVLDDDLNLKDQINKSEQIDGLLEAYNIGIEEICMDPRIKNFRFLPQLHVLAFGNEAGR